MRYTEIYESLVGPITEAAMTPNALRAAAAAIDARAGLEFEMIVPNGNVGDNSDLYADYNNDPYAYDIYDAVNFFDDGEYNDRGSVARMREQLQDDYMEWLDDLISSDWENNGSWLFREYFKDHYFDEDAATEAAIEELSNEDPGDWTADERMAKLKDRVAEKLQAEVDDNWRGGRAYEEAIEDRRDEMQRDNDDAEWFIAVPRSMSEIESEYDITWPHYQSNDSGASIQQEVADDFEEMIGRNVVSSEGYHSAKRGPDNYVVEPDSSLVPDGSGDGGLEFISPPLPLPEMFADIRKIKDWAGMYGCYTNASTGLHMNVSIPGFNSDKLDYVKLALFLGDKYVLEQFGRSSNSYTASAFDLISKSIAKEATPERTTSLFDQLRNGLIRTASKAIHSGSTSKYTSINNQGNYIEFRSPGGDWLEEDIDKLENTLLRFVVALDIACDPEKYKQEYAKKFYKLITNAMPQGVNNDIAALFAAYSAGTIEPNVFKAKLTRLQSERAATRGDGGMYVWSIDKHHLVNYVVAANKDDAIKQGMEVFGLTPTEFRDIGVKVKPMRKATASEAQSGKLAPTAGAGTYMVFRKDSPESIVTFFTAISKADADEKMHNWVLSKTIGTVPLINPADYDFRWAKPL